MPDPTPDDAPTALTPTEMGEVIETEAHTAWALDEGPELDIPRRLTPGQITAIVVGVCVVVIVAAAGVAGYHLRPSESVAVSTPPTTTVNTPPAAASTPPAPPANDRPKWGAPADVAPTKTVTVERSAPVNYDTLMLNNLRAQGWSIGDPAQATAAGRQVCALLRSGESADQVKGRYATEAQAAGERNPYALADQFVHAAMASYPNCP